MSILSSVKKALGFPDEFDEEDDLIEAGNYATVTSGNDKEEKTSPAVSEATANAPAATEPIHSTPVELPGEVFDAVIELFNSIQPEFVRQCLNVESQRTYLISRIDQSLKAKLEAETAAARQRGEHLWNEERRRMSDDIEKLKTEYHTLKQQREEFQSAQLSAARQKRALSERVHDLESQVSTLEAEKEQYQLENRSMLNKLRVANVRASAEGGDAEAELQRLAQDNIQLQDKIKELNETLVKNSDEIQSLRRQLSEQQPEIDPEQAAALAEIEAQISRFEEIKQKKDKKISQLTEQNRKTGEELKSAQSKLLEMDKTMADLNAEIESLRAKNEERAQSSDSTEAELRREIKRLTELVNASAEGYQPRKKRRRKNETEEATPTDAITDTPEQPLNPESTTSEPTIAAGPETPVEPIKISAIDELLDSTDWFIAPDPVPLKKDPEVEEDFGYKEPVRRTTHDDDKQLSLW